MDTLLRSKFSMHQSRFVHHEKLRSSPVKICSHGKLRSSPVKFHSSPVKFRLSPAKFRPKAVKQPPLSLNFNITSFVFGGHAGRVIISIYYGGYFGRNLIGGCLGPFSKFRYGTSLGEWISSILAAPPAAFTPPFPFPPSSSDSKFQCCGQSFRRVR